MTHIKRTRMMQTGTRMSSILHEKLAKSAKRNRQSFNQEINQRLSRSFDQIWFLDQMRRILQDEKK